MKVLASLLWLIMMGCAVAAEIGSLVHGRTPTTTLLFGLGVAALVAGIAAHRAGAR